MKKLISFIMIFIVILNIININAKSDAHHESGYRHNFETLYLENHIHNIGETEDYFEFETFSNNVFRNAIKALDKIPGFTLENPNFDMYSYDPNHGGTYINISFGKNALKFKVYKKGRYQKVNSFNVLDFLKQHITYESTKFENNGEEYPFKIKMSLSYESLGNSVYRRIYSWNHPAKEYPEINRYNYFIRFTSMAFDFQNINNLNTHGVIYVPVYKVKNTLYPLKLPKNMSLKLKTNNGDKLFNKFYSGYTDLYDNYNRKNFLDIESENPNNIIKVIDYPGFDNSDLVGDLLLENLTRSADEWRYEMRYKISLNVNIRKPNQWTQDYYGNDPQDNYMYDYERSRREEENYAKMNFIIFKAVDISSFTEEELKDLKGFKGKYDKIVLDFESLQAQNSNLQQEKESIQNEKQDLETRLSSLTDEIKLIIPEANLNSIFDIKAEINNLKSEISNKESQISRLESEVEENNNTIQNLESEKQILENYKSAIENKLEEYGLNKDNPIESIEALKAKEDKLNSIVEKIKELGYSETESVENILEDLKDKSDHLSRIDALLDSDELFDSPETEVQKILNERKSLFEKLKMPEKDWKKAMRRIDELLRKEQKLEEANEALGSPGEDGIIERIENLKEKENLLKETKEKVENMGIDSNDILEAMDSLKNLKEELEKIKEKANNLGLNTAEIDSLIEELKGKADELDKIQGKVGPGEIQDLIDNLLIDKDKLKVAEEAAKLLNLNNGSLNEIINNLNKENKYLNMRMQAETNAAFNFRDKYFEEVEKNKVLEEELSKKDKLIEKLQKENEMLKSKVVLTAKKEESESIPKGTIENNKSFNAVENIDSYQISFKKANDMGMLGVLTGDLAGQVSRDEVRHLLEIAAKKINLKEIRSSDPSFKDINSNDNINYLWKTGLTNGVGELNYGPNINLDRNMLAAFGLRFNGDFTTDYKDSKDKAISLGLISRNEEDQISRLEIINTIVGWVNKKENIIEEIASKSKIKGTAKKLE